jgi:hypothetical protein
VAIWQAARATTAAPFFFKMLEVDFGQTGIIAFKDGGIRENNPSWCAYSEHASLHGGNTEPSLLVLIGAGESDTKLGSFHNMWPRPLRSSPLTKKYAEKFAVFKNDLIKEAEGRNRHKTMRIIARGDYRWYKRFSVTTGLETMRLDLWESGFWEPSGRDGPSVRHRGGKTINRIQIATEAYLNQGAIRRELEYAPLGEKLKQTAEKLVRLRRAREFEAMTKGGEKRKRWETYMGKHLAGEREFFQEYLAQWDYAMLGRKD